MKAPLRIVEYMDSASDSDQQIRTVSNSTWACAKAPSISMLGDLSSTTHPACVHHEGDILLPLMTAKSPRVEQAVTIPHRQLSPNESSSADSDPDWMVTPLTLREAEEDTDNSEDDFFSYPKGVTGARCLSEGSSDEDSVEERDRSSSSLCFTVMPSRENLQRTLLAQKQALERARAASLCLRGEGPRQQHRSNSSTQVRVSSGKSVKQVWRDYCKTLTKEFLTDDSILIPQRICRETGRALYFGLRITEKNCMDMRFMYETKFATKIEMGQPVGSYNLFRCSLGQFLRVYLLFCPSAINEIWQDGGIFRTVTNMEPVQAFVKSFQIGASPTTVQSKTAQLAKVAIYAARHFGQKGKGELKGRAETVAEYLSGVSAAFKRESRTMYKRRNTVESRVERGAYLAPEDFQSSFKVAMDALSNILSHLREAGVVGDCDENTAACPRRKKRSRLDKAALNSIIDKWSINFLVALIFGGGGQRPQVYAQLQIPEDLQTVRFKSGIHRKYFLLQTSREKTARSNQLGGVVFPKSLLSHLTAHMQWMRPLLVQRLKNARKYNGMHDSYLFLHTRTGYPLRAQHVTKSLRAFLTRIDPELHHLTCMSLRGSYATMMLTRFQKGLIFRGYSRSDFLQFLATCMNTSQEMLETTYASCDSDNFAQVVNEMVKTIEKSDAGEHRDKDSVGNNTEHSTRSNLSVVEVETETAHDSPDRHLYSDVWHDTSDSDEIA